MSKITRGKLEDFADWARKKHGITRRAKKPRRVLVVKRFAPVTEGNPTGKEYVVTLRTTAAQKRRENTALQTLARRAARAQKRTLP